MTIGRSSPTLRPNPRYPSSAGDESGQRPARIRAPSDFPEHSPTAQMVSGVSGQILPTRHWLSNTVRYAIPSLRTTGGRTVGRVVADVADRVVDAPDGVRERMKVQVLLDDIDLRTGRARQAYLDLAQRGEATMNTVRAQTGVARTLVDLESTSTTLDRRVEEFADEMHDTSEELLGWVHTGAFAVRRWLIWPTPHRARLMVEAITNRPTPHDPFTPRDGFWA